MENKEKTKLIHELVVNFKNTFANLEKWNKELNGFTLSHIDVKDYGFVCRIYAPWGMDLNDLEKYTPIIETGCKCKFLYDIPQHNQFAMTKFIYPDKVKVNEQLFTPIKVKPWQFCPGFDEVGDPIIFDVVKTPQIMDAGQQRRGKNGAADTAIVNWIWSCDEKEIMFYMFQGAKNDLSKYKNCKQVYCYTESMAEMIIALEHIKEEIVNRTKLFASMVEKAESNDNIFHYNELHSSKLAYIIIVIDEFISLMVDEKVDNKEIKDQKNKIMSYLRDIAQFGGTYGINYIVLHQKPERALCPTFIKNQSSIRLCFGFEDLSCCSIVLGDELAKYAHKLPPRKAFYSNNETSGYLYTKNLKGQIKKYIEPSIEPGHRTLFGDLKKLENDYRDKDIEDHIENEKPKVEENEIPSNKGEAPAPKIKINVDDTFVHVDPVIILDKEQKIKKNIKNINNYVPYVDNKGLTIIDKTHYDFSKSKKPKKKGG